MSDVEVECIFDKGTSTCQFVVWCPETKKAAIIDPVMDYTASSGCTGDAQAQLLAALVKEKGLTLEYIIETHVHADHMTGAYLLKQMFPDARTCIGSKVTTVQQAFQKLYNIELETDGSQFDKLCNDGEEFTLGSVSGRFFHTPGHTPACQCILIGNTLFCGDTIFMPDMGSARCDFPGGSCSDLYDSIQKIYELPGDTRVFVGHDYAPGGREHAWQTTVQELKENNKNASGKTTKEEFTKFRQERDATLGAPALVLPALQVNLRNGKLPPAESNGISYLKIPMNVFGKK